LIINNFLKGSFGQGVAVLSGGTALAQAITLLALPVLTRLYSADEFGVLGVFTAILGILLVIACFRYEIAVPLPEDDVDAANLAGVAIVGVLLTCLSTTILVAVFGKSFAASTDQENLQNYLWLLPIAVGVGGIYSVFQYWAIRKKAYKRIARTRLEQAIGGSGTQLIMGLVSSGAVGLIIGQIVHGGAGAAGLARRAYSEDKRSIGAVSIRGMREEAARYVRFPKFSMLEALANTTASNIPLILIAGMVAGAEVGYLLLAIRVLQAPMGLIGSSVGQVFYSHAVDAERENRLAAFTRETISKLALTSVLPILLLAVAAPPTFGLVFGDGWERAGVLVAWMAPSFFFQFLSSPVSMTLHILGRQDIALLLQCFGAIARIGAVILFPHFAAEAFAMSGAVFYISYLICILVLLQRSSRNRSGPAA
jgi:O-antigen/teichoic acid export membrane protein